MYPSLDPENESKADSERQMKTNLTTGDGWLHQQKGKAKKALLAVEEVDQERGHWGSQLDFLLSCLGYTVGLSNLWRFPYLCMRNGGGAFLLPYFICLFLCGMPLYFLELVMGQFSSLSPLSVWNLCPLFKGIGWGMVVVSGILTIYYNMVVTWSIYYLGRSFTRQLPWATCDNPWNTEQCVQRGVHKNTSIVSVYNTSSQSVWTSSQSPLQAVTYTTYNVTMYQNLSHSELPSKTPAEEFWQHEMLQMSGGIDELGAVRWELVLCLLLAWIFVFLCLIKGVKSSGKVVYVTATLPYLFLTVLLIRGLLLPGSEEGIRFYLTPDFSRLLEFKVWGEAALQIFYSLGPAWGGLITMSSYNRFNNNCLRDAIIVCFGCAFTSFFAGLVIFSVIGFMAQEAKLNITDVITSGPGLAFIAYPEAITRLPLAPLWAVLFFIMLITLGMDSQFGTFETMVSGFVDEFPKYLRGKKTLFLAFLCTAEFLLGIPMACQGGMYVFQILDWYAGAFSAMVIALLECVVLAWIYGTYPPRVPVVPQPKKQTAVTVYLTSIDRLAYDINLMLGPTKMIWWKICWCGVTPFMLMVIVIFSSFQMSAPSYGDYQYPSWAIGVGWAVAMVSIVPIPLVAFLSILKEKGTLKQRICRLLKPTSSWGPAKSAHRLQYKYATCSIQQAAPLIIYPTAPSERDEKTELSAC